MTREDTNSPNRISRSIRMEDVARLAGVSRATVSRVFNQPELVTQDTRERVQAAVNELQYLPNILAGSMAANRSRVIGLMIPAISNSIFAETISGVSERLSGSGYELMLSESGYNTDHELSILQTFIGRRADGVAIAGAVSDPRCRDMLEKSGTPVVEIWELGEAPVDMAVGFSHEAAGRAAGEYLLSRGYRRMAFVGGTDRRTAARRTGFRAALADAGAPIPREMFIPSPAQSSYDAGGQALRQIIETDPTVQAVFCTNDLLAVGVIFEAQRQAIEIPDRLAVMGFSDLDIAALSVPSLTTVRVNPRKIGSLAADMLLAAIEGHPPPGRIVDVGYSIVRRQSA